MTPTTEPEQSILETAAEPVARGVVGLIFDAIGSGLAWLLEGAFNLLLKMLFH